MNVHGICFFIFVSVFAIGHASPRARPTEIYKTCDSPLGEIVNASVSGCTARPCVLKKGTNITIHVTFKALADVNKLTEDVKGIIKDVPVPFPTPHPDACQTKGLTCPLKKDSINNYTAVTPVSEVYPTLQLIVKWTIKNEQGQDVFCLMIPAIIKS